MKCDQEQAKKWINQIGQQKMTSTYLLQCVEFNVKQAIYDWQNQRTHLIKLTLNSAQFDQEMIKREMNDNEDDDLQIISSEDEIKKDKDEDKTAYEIWIKDHGFKASFEHDL